MKINIIFSAIKKHHGYDPRFDQLHYADTHDNPPYTCSYTPSVDCPDQWCVVSAIRNITGDLEQTTSSSSYPRRYPFGRSRFRINNKHKQHAHSFEFSDIDQQITPTRTASSFVDAHSNIGRDPSEKLKFLVHFVGDIHQPLHVCGKEKGGNGFHVYLDGKLSNLHGVWDYGLIQKRLRHDFGGSLQLYRNYLLQVVNKAVESSMNNDNVEAVKNPLEDLDPARWAVETNAYNCRYVWADIVEYSELDETYYRKNIQLIENLILKAGLRLANTLNSLFSQ